MNHNTRTLLILMAGGLVLVLLVVAAWLYLDRIRVVHPHPAASIVDGEGPGVVSGAAVRRATEQELDVARRALGANSIIALGIERFRLRMGRYPVRLNDLIEEPADLAPEEKWDGPYVNNTRLLVDPWGSRYRYQVPGVHNDFSYDLWTCGADRVNGTADDLGNW